MTKTNIFGNLVLLRSSREPMSGDAAVGFTVALFLLIITSLITMFTY